MGKLFAFFSPWAGVGKVTGAVSSCGSMISAGGHKTAITEIPYLTEGIEEYFDHHITRSLRDGVNSHSGLYALNLMFRGGKLTEEKVRECAVKTIDKNLDIFPAPFGLKNGKPSEDETEIFSELITNDLKNAYDFTLADLGSSPEAPTALTILEKADVVICLLPQNARSWKHFFSGGSRAYETMNKGKTVYLINGYLKKSINNVHTLKFRFGEYVGKNRIFTICANPGMLDAACEGMTAEYFLSNKHIGRKSEEYEFFNDVSEVVRFLKGEGNDGT